MKTYSFEELPAALAILIDEVKLLNQKIDLLTEKKGQENQDEYLDIAGLIKLLPDHPSKPTIYRWTSNRQIPYIKRGRKLIFHKATILQWLNNGRVTVISSESLSKPAN